MRKIMQCGRCGAREKSPHRETCRGRKVKIVVYDKLDFSHAADAKFAQRPDNIRVTDNGGTSADRYTVYRTTPIGFVRDYPSYGPGWVGYFAYMGCSYNPFHPQGIGITGETPTRLWERRHRNGKERPIKWASLPKDVRQCAWQLAFDDTDDR